MEHGIITSVVYDKGKVSCSVQAIRARSEYTNVPLMKSYPGQFRRPKPGQRVVLDKLDDGTRIILGFLEVNDEKSFPKDMEVEEYTLQVDDDTEISFNRRPDDLYDLNIKASGNINIEAPRDEDSPPQNSQINVITRGKESRIDVTNGGKEGVISVKSNGSNSQLKVENTGSNGVLRLEASGENGILELLAPETGNLELHSGDGNLTIDSNDAGDVIIDGLDFDEHVHDYEDELSDGSTTTKTSDKPK